MSNYGEATAALIERTYNAGARHVVVLLRHSAREFNTDIHDLENPLTDAGRDYARRLGQWLPKSMLVRGYASPPMRCVETCELMMAGHEAGGGAITRTRPVEALGVFYALDQQKMWKGMAQGGGLAAYIARWCANEVPEDAMIPAPLAADLLLKVLLTKLTQSVSTEQLDVCVTHDMSVMLMRHRFLGRHPQSSEVAFLDGLVAYQNDAGHWLAAPDADPVRVELAGLP